MSKVNQGGIFLAQLLGVYYIRELIEREGGDERILVSVMYLHDIGYPHLQRGYNFGDSLKAKENHGEQGALLAEPILRKLGYSDSEQKEILALIRHHDNLDTLDSHSRILVMEADSLAQIDWERVVPNFDIPNCIRWLENFRKTRVPKFSTRRGKELLHPLLKKAEEYIVKRSGTQYKE